MTMPARSNTSNHKNAPPKNQISIFKSPSVPEPFGPWCVYVKDRWFPPEITHEGNMEVWPFGESCFKSFAEAVKATDSYRSHLNGLCSALQEEPDAPQWAVDYVMAANPLQ